MENKKLSFYCENKNFKRKIKRTRNRKSPEALQIVDGKIVVNTESIGFEEDDHITSRTYATKKKTRRVWKKEEEERFYESLRCCGSEFSMISTLFPKCTRSDVRNKFKREMRFNKNKVEDALSLFKKFDAEKFYRLKKQLDANDK